MPTLTVCKPVIEIGQDGRRNVRQGRPVCEHVCGYESDLEPGRRAWLVGWVLPLQHLLVDWLVDWLVGWLIGWLVGWLVG